MPVPLLQLQKKTCLMQRSRRFGHGVVVSKICYVQYSDCVQLLDYRILIALSVVTCDCCKPMNHCQDWALSCRCSQNVTHCRKEICSTCLFKESIPETPFGNSKHPLPARSRFLRAAARSTTSALWLHHAHPFVAASEKSTCLMQRSKGFGHGVMAS